MFEAPNLNFDLQKIVLFKFVVLEMLPISNNSDWFVVVCFDLSQEKLGCPKRN